MTQPVQKRIGGPTEKTGPSLGTTGILYDPTRLSDKVKLTDYSKMRRRMDTFGGIRKTLGPGIHRCLTLPKGRGCGTKLDFRIFGAHTVINLVFYDVGRGKNNKTRDSGTL